MIKLHIFDIVHELIVFLLLRTIFLKQSINLIWLKIRQKKVVLILSLLEND